MIEDCVHGKVNYHIDISTNQWSSTILDGFI